MRSERQQLSDLLGTVYDAALDPALWTSVIKQACGYLDCMGGILAAYDLSLEHQSLSASWGFEDKYMATYAEALREQPLIPASFRLKPGEIGSVTDSMPLAEFHAAPGYIKWAKPQGIIDIVQATLDRRPLALSAIGFSRHIRNGPVDAKLRDAFSLLVPHIRRAFLIGKTIDLSRLETSALGETLDGLAAAVFLVDAQGGLLHANRMGEEMLAARGPLLFADRLLQARQATVRAVLAAAVAAAARGDVALADIGVAIPMKAGGAAYAAHVLSLKVGRRAGGGVGQNAAAAVFVRRTRFDFPEPVAAVAKRCGLTAGEARTLAAITATGSIATTGMLLGVSEATVKTHLRHVFAKTGTSRQFDLVKLVAGHVSPLAAS